ncbi:unnamed protein product, partial [Polarella glacialis]
VVTWGKAYWGGDSSAVAPLLAEGVVQVRGTGRAFAAIKANGSVVTWGNAFSGGNSSAVAPLLAEGVVQVRGTGRAFAAIKANGSVVTWGDAFSGGNSSAVAPLLAEGVVQICGTGRAFAAIKANGSVVTWGFSGDGGNSSAVATLLAEGVVQVCGNNWAFAAIKEDGSVVTWGKANYGGGSSAVAPLLTEGVVQISGTASAFAAIKANGSVVTWGSADHGGNSSAVAPLLAEGIVQVCGTISAFAAIKANGSVVTWGNAFSGGNSSAVAPLLAEGVVQVRGTGRAFAAIKANGSVVTWGGADYGGDSSAVAPLLTEGVVQVSGTDNASAAIKANGSVVTWGFSSHGGNSSSALEAGERHGDQVFRHPLVQSLLGAARERALAQQPEGDQWLICVRTYGRAGNPRHGDWERRASPRARGLIFVSHEDPDFTKGADLQVRFIEESAPIWAHLIVADDNIEQFVVENRPKSSEGGNRVVEAVDGSPSELAELIRMAGRDMDAKEAMVWSVSSTFNHFVLFAFGEQIRRNREKSGPAFPEFSQLGLIYGAFFGFRVVQEASRYTRFGQVKDDVPRPTEVERSLRYFHQDKLVLRYKRYAVQKTHKPGVFNEKHAAEEARAIAGMLEEFAQPYARLPKPGEKAFCGLIFKNQKAVKAKKKKPAGPTTFAEGSKTAKGSKTASGVKPAESAERDPKPNCTEARLKLAKTKRLIAESLAKEVVEEIWLSHEVILRGRYGPNEQWLQPQPVASSNQRVTAVDGNQGQPPGSDKVGPAELGKGEEHGKRVAKVDATGFASHQHYQPQELLADKFLNKGTGFSVAERAELRLRGLVPPKEESLALQAEREILHVRAQESNLIRYMYLSGLYTRNRVLFFRVLIDNLVELLPIVYTPTVGEACQKFGQIFTGFTGMYFSIEDRGFFRQMLDNWIETPDIIVATDGGRILGLGDQGAGGMGIPIGKLQLYVAGGGFNPRKTMAVQLDVGTDRRSLLEDRFYLGLRYPRLKNSAHEEFIDEFIVAVHDKWPHCVIQFEDFQSQQALHYLAKYRERYCFFNDDVQGTAAIVTAGLLNGCKVQGTPLSEVRIVFFGAGSAACGSAHCLCEAMQHAGLDLATARSRIYMFDLDGLLTRSRVGLSQWAEPFARDVPPGGQEVVDITELIRAPPACPRGLISGQMAVESGARPRRITRALISAASRPTALDTDVAPKALIDIEGSSLISHVLQQLHRGGILHAVVVVSHHGAVIIAEMNRCRNSMPGLQIEVLDLGVEYKGFYAASLLAARSLCFATEQGSADSEPGVLIATADHIFDEGLVSNMCATALQPGNVDVCLLVDFGKNHMVGLPKTTVGVCCEEASNHVSSLSRALGRPMVEGAPARKGTGIE